MDDRRVHTAELSAAALAVENERLQRALQARLSEEAALRRVATLVAQQHAPETVFAVVTEEVARHLDAHSAITVRYGDPGRATVVASWSAPEVRTLTVGRQIVLSPQAALARVQATLAPARVDSFEGMPGQFPAELQQLGLRAVVAAPIVVDGHLWGAVAASSRTDPFTAVSEARIGAFAELVAQAIANADARIKLKESRARIVEAADDARRRIERDLHDGAQQRLVGVALSLRLVARRAEPSTATAIDGCIEDLLAALAELRELARGLHPAVLTERGLVPALQTLAARSPVPVVLDARLEGRLPPAQEIALYFVAAEASAAEVTLRCDNRWAEIAVGDNGIGGAHTDAGSGLRGLCDRVEALGGHLTLASAPGAVPPFAPACRSGEDSPCDLWPPALTPMSGRARLALRQPWRARSRRPMRRPRTRRSSTCLHVRPVSQLTLFRVGRRRPQTLRRRPRAPPPRSTTCGDPIGPGSHLEDLRERTLALVHGRADVHAAASAPPGWVWRAGTGSVPAGDACLA